MPVLAMLQISLIIKRWYIESDLISCGTDATLLCLVWLVRIVLAHLLAVYGDN